MYSVSRIYEEMPDNPFHLEIVHWLWEITLCQIYPPWIADLRDCNIKVSLPEDMLTKDFSLCRNRWNPRESPVWYSSVDWKRWATNLFRIGKTVYIILLRVHLWKSSVCRCKFKVFKPQLKTECHIFLSSK